jgi:hypothetical protein
MASENPKGDGVAVVLSISPRNVAILRPILEMVREGAQDDFSTPPVAGRPEIARADEHAYRVLLSALDHGAIVPAPHICRALGELAESVDEANGTSGWSPSTTPWPICAARSAGWGRDRDVDPRAQRRSRLGFPASIAQRGECLPRAP